MKLKDVVWKTVQDVRRSALHDLDCHQGTHWEYYVPIYYLKYYRIASTNMTDSVNEIERILKVNVSTKPKENVNQETIEIAGEMFTYLSFCSDEIKGLSKFYIDILKNFSTKDIIQNLNNIIKVSSKDQMKKEATVNIWNKVSKTLGLRNHKVVDAATKENYLLDMETIKDEEFPAGMGMSYIFISSSKYIKISFLQH